MAYNCESISGNSLFVFPVSANAIHAIRQACQVNRGITQLAELMPRKSLDRCRALPYRLHQAAISFPGEVRGSGTASLNINGCSGRPHFFIVLYVLQSYPYPAGKELQ